MTDIHEPHIVVNGIELSTAQAMAVRVALSSFAAEMGAPDALGGDLHGRTMARAYRERLLEVFRIMVPS